MMQAAADFSESISPEEDPENVLNGGSMVFSQRLGQTVWGIAIGLVVPALGLFGVVNGEKLLVQLFMFGNICCSGCGIIFFFVIFFFLIWLNSLTPIVVNCLDKCDPQVCLAAINMDPNSEEGKRRTIDCLADWPDYQVQYQDIPHLKGMNCPPVFLNCTSSLNRTVDSFPGGGSVGFTPTPAPFPGASEFSATRRLLEEEPLDGTPGACPWFQGMDKGPAPEDPMASCRVIDKVLDVWHGLKEATPTIWKNVRSLCIFKMVLLVPAITLSCLGFKWGMDLEKRMSSGYGQVAMAGPGVVGQPVEPRMELY